MSHFTYRNLASNSTQSQPQVAHRAQPKCLHQANTQRQLLIMTSSSPSPRFEEKKKSQDQIQSPAQYSPSCHQHTASSITIIFRTASENPLASALFQHEPLGRWQRQYGLGIDWWKDKRQEKRTQEEKGCQYGIRYWLCYTRGFRTIALVRPG